MAETAGYDGAPLPAGVRGRFVSDVNGLTMHILEAGFEEPGRPCVLLLHGFPELAYSWRAVMPGLAEAGYHVIAPDQRGYGLTTGWDPDYDGDLRSFRLLNIVQDAVALLHALGRRSVAAVVGHDFGSFAAAWCALVRPDVFRSVTLMSAPFSGPPALPFDTDANPPAAQTASPSMDEQLAALARPRKHYHSYYCTRPANQEMWHAPQGVHDFLRAYFHHKSADWTANQPFPLAAWKAEELAKLPTYYIMDQSQTMPETVAPHMPDADTIATCQWMPDSAMAVYATAYERTGFQGGLNWYRCRLDPGCEAELRLFAGRRIEVPAQFIGGASDWGVYQRPGAVEAMRATGCAHMVGLHLVPGAGHWVQQEQPEIVGAFLRQFLGPPARWLS